MNYYVKASRKKEITGNALLKLLESRLDNIVYKAGFAKSKPSARQMVNHGHFKVNGRRATIPSRQIKVGDVIEVMDRSKKSPLFADLTKQKYAPPKWLKVDYAKLTGEMNKELEEDDLEKAISTNLVVEFYSK